MALRKVIGAVKDQTSIGIAKVTASLSPDIEVAVVKATSHHENPASDKHACRILHLTSYSHGHVGTCVAAVSKRLGKTRDWIVALKGLILVHRLLSEGGPTFQHKLIYATRKGMRLLNMSCFQDEAHSNSWDHSAFVRTYAMYLDQKLEFMAYEMKLNGRGQMDRFGSRENYYNQFRYKPGMGLTRSYGEVKEKNDVTPLRDMKPERIFGKMSHLMRLMDRFLSCRPTGMAKENRIVMVALYPVVGESFQLYADLCEVLAVLLDQFFEMEYSDCVRALDCYLNAAKQIDELIRFYNWCKEIGLARSSEFPGVQRITGKLLETLNEFVRDREKAGKSPEKIVEEPEHVEEPAPVMDEIKALPPQEDYTPLPEPESEPQQEMSDLVDLRQEAMSVDDQENRLALALFAGSANGLWDPFSSKVDQEITSAWQTPAAEPGKEDWELALVESTSNLSKQKATLGGGFDPLLLNGIYDQGTVRQHVCVAQFSRGSASSITFPLAGKGNTAVLALPALDGTVSAVREDPFSASLSVLPPSYVQMADMEKKQQLLVQEQIVWQQYAQSGMQGQATLAKIAVGW